MSQTTPTQWLLPGMAAVLFLLALPLLFRADNQFLTDPATARHLRSGELMLQHGAVATADPFGVDQPPRAWVAFEWLFEMGVAELVRLGGLPLAFAVGVVLFALLPVALARMLAQAGVSLPVAFLYAVTASLLFRAHFLLRPVILTYLFMIAVVGWWYRHREGPGRAGWIVLPLLFALWANIHGGFAAALLFLGLSLLGRMMDDWRDNGRLTDHGLLSWLALWIVCANATLLTPHGWHLHRLIWEMVVHIKSFSQWNEFRPPDFAQPSPLALAVLFIGFVLIAGRVRSGATRWSWETLLPLLLFLYFGIKVQRHVLLLIVVAAVPVCRELDAWLSAGLTSGLRERIARLTTLERFNRSYLLWIPFAILVSVPLFLKSAQAKDLRVGAKNITAEAVRFIREHRDRFQRPLVTTWNAGALVYQLAPDFRITFDDRTEFYGDARLKPYIALLRIEPGWQETLRSGGYDSAILDHEFPLSEALRLLPGWKLVYEDKLTVIFWSDRP